MKYKRILLKLSGESLAGANQSGIDAQRLNQYASEIKEVALQGCAGGCCDWRWKYFPRLAGRWRWFRPGAGRIYGHACHGHQQPCSAIGS